MQIGGLHEAATTLENNELMEGSISERSRIRTLMRRYMSHGSEIEYSVRSELCGFESIPYADFVDRIHDDLREIQADYLYCIFRRPT